MPMSKLQIEMLNERWNLITSNQWNWMQNRNCVSAAIQIPILFLPNISALHWTCNREIRNDTRNTNRYQIFNLTFGCYQCQSILCICELAKSKLPMPMHACNTTKQNNISYQHFVRMVINWRPRSVSQWLDIVFWLKTIRLCAISYLINDYYA